MTKVKDVLEGLDGFAPFRLAQSWDNSGFLCGEKNNEVKKALISLDITEEVVKEAIDLKADVILSHHPLIFTPLKSVTDKTAEGKLILMLIKNGISAICAHTNLDIAKEGVNFALARKLGLSNIEPVTSEYEYTYRKIAVYVPPEFAARVKNAMFEGGAGELGNYKNCSFSVSGTGTFMPGDKAEPFIGEKNKLEQVSELKIEMMVPTEKCAEVISLMKASHPYETPAYDVYAIDEPKEALGFCAVGDLEKTLSGHEFLNLVKESLGCEALRFCGAKDGIKRVGVGGGSCFSFSDMVYRKGADVFVTGDIKYHDFQSAAAGGRFLVDAGHFATENVITEPLRQIIAGQFPEIEVVISERHADIIRFF